MPVLVQKFSMRDFDIFLDWDVLIVSVVSKIFNEIRFSHKTIGVVTAVWLTRQVQCPVWRIHIKIVPALAAPALADLPTL